MIPNYVRIGCYDYNVEIVHQNIVVGPEVLVGRIDYNNHVIQISSEDKSEQLMHQIFWHEVMHGIDNFHNIGLTEEQIDLLATGLYGFVKTNGIKGDD